MRYRRILKWKVYPTWVSIKRLNGCKITIRQTPNLEYFFFEITCYSGQQFSSIGTTDEGRARFKTFEEVRDAAESWIKENIAYS